MYSDASEPRTAEKVHSAAGMITKKYGIKWGGEWKTFADIPRFQVRTGKTQAQLHGEIDQREHPARRGLRPGEM
jgi:hypothetical protein